MWITLLKPYLIPAALLVVFAAYTFSLKMKCNAVEAEFELLKTQLQAQSKELENYKKERNTIKEKIITKYKNIIIKDDNCENTLKSAKEMLSKVGE